MLVVDPWAALLAVNLTITLGLAALGMVPLNRSTVRRPVALSFLALSHDEAEAELRRVTGVQLDPSVVEAFLRSVKGGAKPSVPPDGAEDESSDKRLL